MEEKFIEYRDQWNRRPILVTMSHQHQEYLPFMHRSITKMNQSFSTHVRRINKNTVPFKQIHKLGSTHLLTKNRNKIEENILKHRSIDSRKCPARNFNKEKKTQLIINKPYYLQYFKPKTYQEILERHHHEQNNPILSSKDKHKSSIMKENIFPDNELLISQTNFLKPFQKSEGKSIRVSKNSKLQGSRLLLSSNFGSYMDLKKFPSKQFNKEISVFCRRELECYYQSLLKFSGCDPKKYKQGLQTMLNLMQVASNQKVLSKQLSRFQQNPTFSQFVQIYTKIVDANMRQNVMDFFDIIFQQCGHKQLNKQQFLSLLSQRMTKADAMEITQEIFYQFNCDKKTIEASDIFTLCFTSDQFCMFMKKITLHDHKKK